MVHRVKYLLFLLLVLQFTPAFSQFDNEVVPDSIVNKILYNRIRTFGIVATNLGYGIRYKTGKRLSYFNTRMWEFEGVYMYSYKQIRLLNPYYAYSKKYVYGKLNDVFFLRAGISWKKLLNRKPYYTGGVEVRLLYGGGFSLALAKPYYLYVVYYHEVSPGQYTYETRTEKFDPANNSWDDIYGRAPFTKGFGEITFHPGLYAKIGLNFEFGKAQNKVKSLEIGGNFDVIPGGVVIMSGQHNTIFYPTLYLAFSFGKRFNKY